MAQQNKLGITATAELAAEEERISKLRVRELYDSGRLATIDVGTFAALCEIHRTMFGDIYENAGELRTVNVYKGNTRFSPVEGLKNAVKFADIMPQSTFDEIVEKYAEMHMAHPFRSGNGRAMRIWLDVMMADAFGKLVDWMSVDINEYKRAMENCAMDSRELKRVLAAALTDKVGRSVFLSGVDASYAIEGFRLYRTEQL